MQIDLNIDTLSNQIGLLNSINSQFADLSAAMNRVKFDGVTLESASVFNQAKVSVNNVINSGSDVSILDLKNKIEKVRNLLVNSNSSMASLFSNLDSLYLEEFGNFVIYDTEKFNYVQNIYELLDLYNSGTLKKLGDNVSLAKYYDDSVAGITGLDYIKNQISNIEKLYSGREAVVNGALKMLSLAANKGSIIDYQQTGTFSMYPETTTEMVAKGVNCNAFVSWAISLGVFDEFHWRSCKSFTKDGKRIEFENWNDAQPGDIFVYSDPNSSSVGGHVGLIVANDSVNNKFITAEEVCSTVNGIFREGLILTTRNYDDIYKKGYQVRDMSSFYDNSSNIFDVNNSVNLLDQILDSTEIDIKLLSNETVSNYNDVPLYLQQDYSSVAYGKYGTVSSHGCGVTSLAMVASYLLDRKILPDELAKKYGSYNTEGGSSWTLFSAVANDYGLTLIDDPYYSVPAVFDNVVEHLKNGNVVIANANEKSIFTNSGHYIVLTGITEDGKIIVNDPNKYNYDNVKLADGFANGFDTSAFKCGTIDKFWIFDASNKVQNHDSNVSVIQLGNQVFGYNNILSTNINSLTSDVDLFSYLGTNYNTCEKRVANNGSTYYYVKDGINEYYFSSDCASGEVDLYGCFPGQGGNLSSYSTYKNGFKETGIPSNSVVALSGKDTNDKLFSSIDKIIKDTNMKVNGAHVVSFSGSGHIGFKALNNYLKENPQIKNSSMVVADGYNISGSVINNSDKSLYSELKERGTKIYMVEPTWPGIRNASQSNVIDMSINLDKLGFDTYYVKENSGTGHNNVFANKLLLDGLNLFLSGKVSKLNNASDYTFVDNVSEYKNKMVGLSSIYEISRLTNIDSFKKNDLDNETMQTIEVGDIKVQGKVMKVQTEYVTMDDNTKYQVNIIGDLDKDTPVIIVNHGGGRAGNSFGDGGDYKYLEELLKNRSIDSNVVIVRYDRSTNGGAATGAKIANHVTSNYNLSVENCVTAGFSAGGEPALKQMADIIRQNSNIESPAVVLVDGYLQTKPSKVVSKNDLKLLGDNNTVLFAVNQRGWTSDVKDYESWSEEYGVNVIRIEDEYCYYNGAENSHSGTFKNYFNLGLLDFQTGQGKFPSGGFTDASGVYHSYYSTKVYNSNTNNWELFDISGKTLAEVYEQIGVDYNKVVSDVKPVVPEVEPIVPEVKPVVPEVEPIVPEVKPVVPEVEPIVPEVKPVVPEVEPIVPEVKPVVPEVEPIVPEVKPVVPEVEPIVPEVKPVVPEVEPIVPEVKPVVPEVEPIVPEVKPVVPEVEPIVPEVKPVVPEVEPIVPEVKPVVPEVEPVVPEVKPVVPGNNNSSNISLDSKKYILPGILGAGLALLSAKINKFIKKSKKNNDI